MKSFYIGFVQSNVVIDRSLHNTISIKEREFEVMRVASVITCTNIVAVYSVTVINI